MPQRRKVVEEDAGSLDSLMDALTNVVAVLIFVLLLVNCEVSQKVVQMMEDLVPASPEEIQRLKDQLKQIEIDKQKLEELKKLPPPPKVDLDSINQKISALQTLIQNKKSAIDTNNKNIAELQKLHDEKLAARDAEQAKANAMMEEIASLEAMLDTTPVAKDIPATEITIPATRSIPEGAKVHYAYIVGDRAYFLDLPKYMEDAAKIVDDLKKDKNNHMPTEEKAEEEEDKKLSAAERRAKREQEKADAKKEKPIVLNRDKALPVLSEKLGKLMAPGLNYAVIAQPWWGFARLDISFNDKGGATIEELKQPTNSFASALSKLRPPNDVLMFRVDPPSMYAYALAREIADKKGIPCGWELSLPGECFSRTDIPNFAINATGAAPARDPNWKPPERARGTGSKLD
jgi:myosin heavy subunit